MKDASVVRSGRIFVGLRHDVVSILGIMHLLNGHKILKGILVILVLERKEK